MISTLIFQACSMVRSAKTQVPFGRHWSPFIVDDGGRCACAPSSSNFPTLI